MKFIRNTAVKCAESKFDKSDDILTFYNVQKTDANYVNLTHNNGEGKWGSVYQISNDHTSNEVHVLNSCQMINNSATNLMELYLRSKTNSLNIHCLVCLGNQLMTVFMNIESGGGITTFDNCLFYGNRVGKSTKHPKLGDGSFIITKCYIEKGTTVSGSSKSDVVMITKYQTAIPGMQTCFPTGTFSAEYQNPYDRNLLVFLIFGSFFVPFK